MIEMSDQLQEAFHRILARVKIVCPSSDMLPIIEKLAPVFETFFRIGLIVGFEHSGEKELADEIQRICKEDIAIRQLKEQAGLN